MRKSDLNRNLLENFLLHVFHSDDKYNDTEETTSLMEMHQHINNYIDEDHVNGRENPEDFIPTLNAESSWTFEDKDKTMDEYIVIVADYGEKYGTKTVCTIDNIENLEAIKDLLKLFKNPYLGLDN